MRIKYRFWFETDRGYVLGPGTYTLLKEIEKTGSLRKAAERLNMSYRHAWGLIKEMEENLGKSVIVSERGGKGGGKSELTVEGKKILQEFENYKLLFDEIVKRPYRKPWIAVDAVLIHNDDILLIKRGKEPFKGKYALPGGFVDYGETTEHAVIREVKEETGLNVAIKDLVGVYSDPARDPRGHTISVSYLVEVKGGKLKSSDDAAEARWFPLNSLPSLAFDHDRIIKDALSLLR